MIEFCTKKRMIAGTILLVGISVVVLVIENNLPLGHHVKDTPPIAPDGSTDNGSKACWETVQSVVTRPCHQCDSEEKLSQSQCSAGNVEQIRCIHTNGTTNELYRSCAQSSHIEERNFWLFECSAVVIGVASYGVVHLRQRRLDRLLIEKVHKQIAAGV